MRISVVFYKISWKRIGLTFAAKDVEYSEVEATLHTEILKRVALITLSMNGQNYQHHYERPSR